MSDGPALSAPSPVSDLAGERSPASPQGFLRSLFSVLAILATATFAAVSAALAQGQAGTAVVLDGSLVGYPRVEVRGMTVYDPAATWNFALAHVLQTEGTATAVQMAKAIELTYREDGYFLARVHIVPGPQPGTAVLLVEEGHIGTIEVIGVNERIGERVASYMKPVADGGPVRLADFERALMLAGAHAGGRSRRRERAVGSALSRGR